MSNATDFWAKTDRTQVWENVTREQFENEISPRNQPAILKGLCADWPVVKAADESPAGLTSYLRSFDSGKPVDYFHGEPSIGGRFFYSDDL